MSKSSLWIIDKNWSGKEYTEYDNSWLFNPVIWNVLMCKYIDKSERELKYPRRGTNGEMVNYEETYLGWTLWGDSEKTEKLNSRINASPDQTDRVLWELSNLSVFNAKDKNFVADCVEDFAERYIIPPTYADCQHIKDRFLEIAKDIRELPKRCKYFVVKGTSCDDNVEYWFNRKRLSSWNEPICEFTIIENKQVVGFLDNLEMCRKAQ